MNDIMLLSIRDLSVEYRKDHTKIGIINLSIRKGEVLGLTGESGSGKSTVCKAILGLLDDKTTFLQGSIRLYNQEILCLPARERRKINGKDIALIMQNPMTAFDPCMKMKGHFVETLCAHMSCNQRDAVLYGLDLLKDLGMKEPDKVMKSYPHQLSGGMLQRVMIALAVALNPVLIIADEPTTALDGGNEAIVLDLLHHIRREYAPAMLLVSHDMEVLAAMADRVAVMKEGKILEMSDTRQLFFGPQHDYTKELLAACCLPGEEDGFADD